MRLLDWSRPEDRAWLDALREASRTDPEVVDAARAILADVARRGDHAVRAHTAALDGVALDGLELPAARWEALAAACPAPLQEVIRVSADRIRAFHAPQKGHGFSVGACRQEVRPLRRVGLYAPGGRARYPSTVLMLGIPATVAGVEEIVLVTPPGHDGEIDPAVAFAARVAGVHRIFRVGGAQAVAALALGTETVPRVDAIVGPGNAWVAAAKRLVSDRVGVDLDAGPSEVLVVADHTARAEWVARDLVAQAEHDPRAVCVLATTSSALAHAALAEVERVLAAEPNPVAAQALAARGAAVVVRDLDVAAELIDAFAPEHLELEVADPEALLRKIRNAGAVFLGGLSPAPLGDYLAGPNHTLPTGGAARFQSGLGVAAFEKRINVVGFGAAELRAHGAQVAAFARAEGLVGHARAVEVRLDALSPSAPARPDVASFARDAVRRQRLYTLEGAPPDAEVKLNQNEAPEDLPAALKAEVFERLAAAAWNKYPAIDAGPLRERLAALYGWRADGVAIGNGSNALLSLLYRVVVRPGDRVVVPTPCFSMYPVHLDLADAVIDPVAIRPDGFDVEALLRKARGARLVMLATPNNPTGTPLQDGVIEALLDTGALIAVDEAYAEWAPDSATRWLGEDVPLVVLRTFSKAWGVAGARVGSILGPPRFVDELTKVRLPFSVGLLAQTVADVLLDHPGLLADRIGRVAAERERLVAALGARGLTPWPTLANFILFDCGGRPPRALYQALLDRGVLIRDLSGAVPGHLRVSVGTEAENDRFLAALDAALAGA